MPFLAPIVIDDTAEAGAAVPAEFMKVQWTRLPGALPSPQFVEQVRRLLGREQGTTNRKTEDRGQRTEVGSPPSKTGLPGWTWVALIAVVVGIGVALLVSRKAEPVAPPASVLPARPEPAERAPASPPKADSKSIAVLPFANRSNQESDVFFTDGIHDDLLTQISRIRAIKTISRTSVMGYRGTTKNMRTIGAELGVSTILEGGIQRAGNRIRINVQLIDAATDAHLWAEIYDRELTAENIFKIQTEVATAIAAALRATLLPEEQKGLEKLPTSNLAALEVYFQGKTADSKSTSAGLQEAEAHYRRALDLDPGFVEAYAQLAGVYLDQIYYSGLAPDAQAAKAEPLIAHALALEPQSSSALAALGLLKRMQHQPAESEVAFRQAIAANPNHSRAYINYSLLLRWDLGRPEEALAMLAKARELEPGDPGLDSMAAEFMRALGRIDEARALLEELTRKAPDFAQGYRVLGQLYMDKFDRPDLALAALRQGYALDPASPVCAGMLGDLYYGIGEPAKAVEWYERTLRLAPNNEDAPWRRVRLYRLKGEPEKAWALLEAYASGQAGIPRNYAVSMLGDRDLLAGRPQDARARFAAAFPALVDSPDPVINAGNYRQAANLALVLAATGEKERAALLLHRAKPLAVAVGNDNFLAQILAQLGDKRQAIATLRRFTAASGPFAQFDEILSFRGLQDDPEFQALVQENQAKHAAQRARLRELEASGTLAPIPPLPEAKP